MVLSDKDAEILREYLNRGGFWMLDDFWGSFEWAAMEKQIRKILPNVEIKDIPKNHAIFHQFFDIDKIMQVPSLAYVFNGGITWEQDGFVAECKGIFDDNGRLMVMINHNTDLGDAYQWMDIPEYPYEFSSCPPCCREHDSLCVVALRRGSLDCSYCFDRRKIRTHGEPERFCVFKGTRSWSAFLVQLKTLESNPPQ